MLFDLIGKKSKAERAEDDEFLEALNSIKTLQVKDGCVSMDYSDLKEKVKKSRETARKLVDSK
jgi:predicted nucleotidyltransferase